ncbi:MAG: 30S ribosome-binding factor RbfA [Pseudomonadota bacterium]
MNNRSRRVADQIRQELASILLREMKDPRVVGVTFTAVEVTSDLEHAKVWFTTYTGEPETARQGLVKASGFLRSELAQRMKMRTVPKLNFVYDASVERGAHLSRLIDEAVASDRQNATQDATQAPHKDET